MTLSLSFSPQERRASFDYRLVDIESERAIAVSVVSVIERVDATFADMSKALLSQSLQNIEWIIVAQEANEALIQLTLQNLDALRRGRQVRVLCHTFSSKHQAISHAVEHAKASFICLLDSDSLLDATYLEKALWCLDANAEFAFCNALAVQNGSASGLNLDRGLAYITDTLVGGCGVLIRKNILSTLVVQNVFCDRLWYPHFLLAIAASGQWGITIPEQLHWMLKAESYSAVDLLAIKNLIRNEYAMLLSHFPTPQKTEYLAYHPIKTHFPADNKLTSSAGKLRIMFIIPWMVMGGADKFNLDLVEMLVNRGHEVTLCATLKALQQWEHLFTKLTPDVFVLSSFLEQHDFPRFLSYLIQSRGINAVVISGSTMGYQLLPYLRANSPTVSFLDLCHVEEPQWQNGGHPRFGVGYQDLLDLNIVSTQHLAEWMTNIGADRKRIRVLHTGVDAHSESDILAKRAEIRMELGISDTLPLIIYAGRICQQKRPSVLARILKNLRDENTSFHVLVIGDGEQRASFESLLKEYGLDEQVSMLGAVKHDRWLALLQAADIFLLPSDYEGISIALLEAMSVGVVPVVSDVGGQSEIVAAGCGYLIPHGELEYAGYHNALMSLLPSPSLRQQMGKCARTLIARQFLKEVTIQTFEQIIAESRHLTSHSPRTLVANGLAKELTIATLELNRLNDAVHWLWGSQQKAKQGERLSFLDWLLIIKRTHIGNVLYQNTLLRRFVTFLLVKVKSKRIGNK